MTDHHSDDDDDYDDYEPPSFRLGSLVLAFEQTDSSSTGKLSRAQVDQALIRYLTSQITPTTMVHRQRALSQFLSCLTLLCG